MTIKFSEDLVPLTDLKVNPGCVVKHVIKKNRLVLLTSRGRSVAVIQSVADYEKTVNPFCTNSSICHFR